ncbi:MAG: hypothetical protein VXX56_04275 [Pseudomonadota bacterium]|nr:hypothetical protein [Pseudomonadota bacterium]MEC8234516.1 hypothetical protein [Pseudomonadota bacterium]MEC8751352.1 hypothetical protein [Pseudomonadota bacterium]MEE3007666.1 hypothetical protein [Pseudomonadota bacterium]
MMQVHINDSGERLAHKTTGASVVYIWIVRCAQIVLVEKRATLSLVASRY